MFVERPDQDSWSWFDLHSAISRTSVFDSYVTVPAAVTVFSLVCPATPPVSPRVRTPTVDVVVKERSCSIRLQWRYPALLRAAWGTFGRKRSRTGHLRHAASALRERHRRLSMCALHTSVARRKWTTYLTFTYVVNSKNRKISLGVCFHETATCWLTCENCRLTALMTSFCHFLDA